MRVAKYVALENRHVISTFDLTLLGSLVSAGGLVFLRQGKWPHLDLHRLGIGKRTSEMNPESLEHHARSTMLVGARWLTVGALTLFIAFAHGAKEGYLFGPWIDVFFHIAFVASCWSFTAFRMQQAAERAATVTFHTTTRHQPSS